MAKLSKDIYDKKASWAAARMLSNKSIKSLTEEQHDAISEIASIRHNLHVSSGGNPNRYDVEGYHNFFGATFLDSKGKLMEIIEENNLPKFKPYLIIDEFTYLGGDDWNDDEIDGYDENLDLDSEDYDKKYDAYLNIVLDNIELLDQSVRDYLAYIDYLYGTNYSPSRGDYSKYVEEPKKMAKGGEIKATTDGKKGGLLYGKSHAQGGIKAVVTDAGNKEIELEGGEAVVKKSALKDKTVKTLTGTNAEILNKINTEAGGNPIYAPSDVKMKNGGSVGSDILSPYLENLKINGIVLYDKDLIVLMYNTGSQKRNKNLYSPTILRKYLNNYSEEVANQLTLDLAMEWYDLFDEKDIPKYLKHDRIIVVNNSKVVFDNQANMAKGGSITPRAISKMTKAEQKAFYKTKEGKELDKQTHAKWKSLVNMSKGELKSFYNSKEGKEAGLSASEAKAEGIDSGRESARWIMKMKDIPYTEWTSNMWVWAKKQISFVSRMKGMKGDLYDDKGNKTRKHLALLIWGHNPKKMAEGGSIESDCISFIKKSEAIKNNGYFHYFKNTSVYANFGAKDPKVKSFYLCSYNSGGQKNLKVTDTINLDLVNKLQSIIGCEKGVCIIIIDEFMRKAKRVEKNDLKRMARENILVVDRDKVTCDNINSKMAEGGNVGEVTFTDYKGEQIMFEPHNNEYFVIGNDENIFKSMEEAKQFIDNPKSVIQTEYAKMVRGEMDGEIRFAEGGSVDSNLKNALKDLESARSVKYWLEPEFSSEAYKYEQKGNPDSFVKIYDEKYNADTILAYNKRGNLVGLFSISKGGKEQGAFKIVVREDSMNQGWGKKLLDEAERQGIDIVGNIKNNSFTNGGRNLLKSWLSKKMKANN